MRWVSKVRNDEEIKMLRKIGIFSVWAMSSRFHLTLTGMSTVSEQCPLDWHSTYVHSYYHEIARLTVYPSAGGLQLVRCSCVHLRFISHFRQDLPCHIALHAAPIPSSHVQHGHYKYHRGHGVHQASIRILRRRRITDGRA